MKNYNTLLTENQQKYLHYHQAKLNKCEYLTGEEILPLDQNRIIDLHILH